LLSLLGFIQVPSSGEIRFNGALAAPFDEAVRGKVALMPQASFLLKRSVFRNVAYGLKALKHKSTLRQRVEEALTMVGLDPAAYCARPWFALSGGEARRVALAARLALRPKVLIMDEPTTSVDAASAQMIKEAALHARRQWGATLVISSHDLEWLEDICTDTLHLFRSRPMGSSRRTLVFGPWERRGTEAAKMLDDGQCFLAADPPLDLSAAVAAIEARHLALRPSPTAIPPGRHALDGLLLRLSYEQTSGRIRASVSAGGTALAAYLPEGGPDPSLRPGTRVRVVYDPADAVWC
jgi:tungstate transport system ATP-binding protein